MLEIVGATLVDPTEPPEILLLSPLEPGTQWSLRMRGENVVPGVVPALAINRCAVLENSRIVARLGPDEWLLLGPAGDDVAAELAASLQGRFFALVDISHRDLGFMVSGPASGACLNAGCPLDLDDAAFPAGSATRTLLGKAEIVLIRPGSERAYRVLSARSFAPYVHAFLKEAARS